ncbi:MAG: DUF1328 domain-containing protein [Chloroflexota bacterium]
MLGTAIVFLAIPFIAAVLGFGGIGGREHHRKSFSGVFLILFVLLLR